MAVPMWMVLDIPADLGDRDWMRDAACRGMCPKRLGDKDVFFPPGRMCDGPTGRARTREAREVCATCVVTDECQSYADTFGIQYGVWAGEERKRRAYGQ